MPNFICYNGQFYHDDKVPLRYDNRAFKYGDAIFETIRCNGQQPLYFKHHYRRLIKAMFALKLNIASLPKEEELEEEVIKLLNKNKVYKASRVRLQVYRSGGGLYTPESSLAEYLIEHSLLKSDRYSLSEKGLLVDIYPEMKKYASSLSFCKNGNSLMYVLAAIYKQENNLGDCFLLNDKGKIIEGISSNLFWIKDNTLYTPSVFSGCVDGVMRRIVIQTIHEEKLMNIVENHGADEEILYQADEVFLTNAIQGIQWIVGFRDKRYFNQKIKKIVALINARTFN